MNIIFEKIKNLIPYKSCLKQRENGSFLIVENEGLDVYYLNESSKDFYELCDGNRTIDNIVDLYMKIYDVPRDILEEDFLNLIRDFQWKDILSLREDTNESI